MSAYCAICNYRLDSHTHAEECPEGIASGEDAARKITTLQTRAQTAEARVAQLETTLARVAEWTHTFGAELKPRRADTYGEGVRDSKERVASIVNVAMVTGGTGT